MYLFCRSKESHSDCVCTSQCTHNGTQPPASVLCAWRFHTEHLQTISIMDANKQLVEQCQLSLSFMIARECHDNHQVVWIRIVLIVVFYSAILYSTQVCSSV